MSKMAIIFAVAAGALLSLGSQRVSSAAAQPEITKLKHDEEMILVQSDPKCKAEIHVCDQYFVAFCPLYGVTIAAHAPDWTVREIAPKRKIYSDTPLSDWARKGTPFHMLYLGTLPRWPLVRTGEQTMMNVHVTKYVLPYLSRSNQPVAIANGTTGEMFVFHGCGSGPFSKLQQGIFHLPPADGLTIQLKIWNTSGSSKGYNKIFIYSGNKHEMGDVLPQQISTGKKRALPSVAGFKRCSDSREIWVDPAQNDALNDMLR